MSNTGFKGIDVRQTGSALVFRAFMQTSAGAKETAGPVTLALYELQNDGSFKSYDFNDNTFKTTALTTATASMTHQKGNNNTVNTGVWTYALSTLTGFTVGAVYLAQVNDASASPTDQTREFQYGSEQGDLVVTANGTGVGEINSDVQFWKGSAAPANTGDAYARIGAAGVGLTNLGDTRIAHLDADISSRMATFTLPTNFAALGISAGGHISNVDTVTTVTGGATSANQTSILNAVNAITTNTSRTGITIPQFVALPASGTSTVRVKITLYNLQGALEDADTNTVTVHASDASGTSLDANLSATTATRDSAGQYHVDYTVHSTDAEGGVYIAATYQVGGVNMAANAVMSVAQADTLTSIAAIKAQTDKLLFDGSNFVKANAQTVADKTGYTATVGAYGAGQDPWSQLKGAVPGNAPTAGTLEWYCRLLDADVYTTNTSGSPWEIAYMVRGTGAPGTGTQLLLKGLYDTGGNPLTSTTVVVGGCH